MIEENIFYKRLIKLIKLSQKSINEVERELNYPRNSLSNYKNGSEPSGSRLLELASYFEVSPKYLLGKSNSPVDNSILANVENLDLDQKKKLTLICLQWLVSKIDFIDET